MEVSVRIENTYHVSAGGEAITHEFTLKNRSGVNHIIEWYASFYAGDPFRVWLNDIEQTLDGNGCIAEPRINGGVEVVWVEPKNGPRTQAIGLDRGDRLS